MSARYAALGAVVAALAGLTAWPDPPVPPPPLRPPSAPTWPMSAANPRPVMPWRLWLPGAPPAPSRPAGLGKTLLARRLPGSAAGLTERADLERRASTRPPASPCCWAASSASPFRAPYHTPRPSRWWAEARASMQPGEVSWPIEKVLFLDKLSEFDPVVLGNLRQPWRRASSACPERRPRSRSPLSSYS